MTTAPEQEWRYADAGFRGLVLLIQCQRSVARLLDMSALRLQNGSRPLYLRIAQLHQDFGGPATVGGRQARLLRQLLRGSVMGNGLLIRAVLLGDIAGRDPS